MKLYRTLDLKDNQQIIEQYRYWHSSENIWKEIPEGIRRAGILEMEIFLWKNRLFMVVEVKDDFDWEQ
jgi:L-rhamnose mutarotase